MGKSWKTLVQLYNTHLCYATWYTLVHWHKLLYLASPSPIAGGFTDPPTVVVATRRPQDDSGDHPSCGGSGDEPGGRIPRGDTTESLERRHQASWFVVFRTSACTWERCPTHSLIGYMRLRNRMTLTCFAVSPHNAHIPWLHLYYD